MSTGTGSFGWFRAALAIGLAFGAWSCQCGSSSATAASSTGAVAPEVLAKICSATCAGPYADVTVWRDANGAIGRIVMQGDLQSCADPPAIYFDAGGKIEEQIGSKPVGVGSPEERAFADRRARLLEGLTQAESLACRKSD